MSKQKHTPGPYIEHGIAIYSAAPHDIDHAYYRGFNEVAPGAPGYLIAESIPHGPTRKLFVAAPETAAELDRLKAELEQANKREDAYRELCKFATEMHLRAASSANSTTPAVDVLIAAYGTATDGDPIDAVRSLGWLCQYIKDNPASSMGTTATDLMRERDRLREIVHPLLANAELFNRGTDEDWVALKNKAQAALAETHPYRPDAERDRLRKALETIRNGQHTYAGIRDIADVALAEAPPPRPDAGQVNAELLEALKRVLSWVKNWNPSFCEDDEWAEDNKAFRALIAKAEEATP
jgi:hypothetical protein